MAQEGISTLPQSPENAPMSFEQTLMSSKEELGRQFPQEIPAYDQGMEQIVQQMDLPPEELNVLKQILEYLLQNEAEYPQLRQRLINEAGVNPEDIPEEFDRGYLTTMLVVVQEALSRKQGMGGSMPEPQGFRRGGLAAAAEALRKKGRGGDTILAHINPQEAKLLKAMGGSGTINPATGIMEFKGGGGGIIGSIGKAFSSVGNAVKSIVSSPVGKIVATVALTAALGPGAFGVAGLNLALPAAAALSAGAVSLAGGSNLKDSLKAAAIGGAMGWAAPQLSSMLPGAGGFLNAAATGAILGGGYGAITGQNIAKSALTGGLLGGVLSAAGGAKAFGPAQPTVSPTDTSFSQGMSEYGGSAPTTSSGISTLPSGQTNLQAPTPDYDFTGLSAEARTPTFDIGFGPDRFSPPPAADTSFSQGMREYGGGPAQARAPLTDTSLSQGMREYGGGPTQAAGQRGPLTDTSLSQGMREYGGGGPNQPSSTGIGSYFDKAKDYLFSSDPSNPGFFYNSKGEISVPAVVGTVIAGGALMDGFKTAPVTPPGIVNRNITGETLIAQNPDQYIVKGIPGYNAPPPPPAYAGYVPTPTYGPGNNPPVYPVYTPPGMAATARPGQGIMQPYNYNPYTFAPMRAAKGGITRAYPRKTGSIDGPGTGTSDSIPAMLSDGEFVITAKAVRGAGGGSRREGAKKLYRMMHALEKKAGGKV